MICRYDGATESRTRWNLNLFEVQLAGLFRLNCHLLVTLQPSTGFGLPSLGVGSYPVEFVPQPLLQFGVLLSFHLEAGGLLLQIGRVVALVGEGPTTIQLQDPLRHVV